MIKRRKGNQRGGASVSMAKRILRRGPSLTNKLAYAASMLLSGPAPGFGTLGKLLGKQASKGIMDNVKHYAYLVESMSMLLTLSSGVVALRSHHTYRLRRG